MLLSLGKVEAGSEATLPLAVPLNTTRQTSHHSLRHTCHAVLLYLGEVEEGGETTLPLAEPLNATAQALPWASECASKGELAVRPKKGGRSALHLYGGMPLPLPAHGAACIRAETLLVDQSSTSLSWWTSPHPPTPTRPPTASRSPACLPCPALQAMRCCSGT